MNQQLNMLNQRDFHQICHVGIYCRLSRDDNNGNESNSITSQKAVLSEFVKKQGWLISNIYVDDGYSGTNFNRPGFKKMLADIESKKLDCVVVKDLSRLGRNYLDSGYYIEEYFPRHNIRFIALNDNMDSVQNENEFAPFKNIINEWYAKDISKKIKFSLNNKALKGNLVQGHAPYGYVFKEGEKYNFEIDLEAAKVVQYIFEASRSKISCKDITNKLKKDKIFVPGYYQYIKNGINPNRYKNCPEEEKYDWTFYKINSIIRNEVYTGTLVNYKMKKVSFRSKKIVLNDKNKILKTYDRFPAIISRELYEEVKSIKKERFRQPRSKEENPFLHIIYCAQCDKYLRLKKSSFNDPNKTYYYYRCEKASGGCGGHTIKVDDLKKLVSDDFLNVQELLRKLPKEKFIEEINKSKKSVSTFDSSSIEVEQITKRLSELDNIISKLIDSYSKQIIPEATYIKMMKKYKEEYEQLEAKTKRFKEKKSIKKELSIDDLIRNILSIKVADIYKNHAVQNIISKIYLSEEDKHTELRIEYYSIGTLGGILNESGNLC